MIEDSQFFALQKRVAELERLLKELTNSRGSTGNVVGVTLSASAGSAGTKTTEPALTYTISDINGNPMRTGVPMTGHGQRLVNAAILTAGGRGFAVMVNGTPQLWWADERYDQKNC